MALSAMPGHVSSADGIARKDYFRTWQARLIADAREVIATSTRYYRYRR